MENDELEFLGSFSKIISNKGEALASLSQYKEVWSQCTQSIQYTTRFLTALIYKLLLIENNDETPLEDIFGKPYMAKPGDFTLGSISAVKESFCNTIYFVALFYKFDSHDIKLKMAISSWTMFMKERPQLQKNNSYSDVLKLLNTDLESEIAIIGFLNECSHCEFTNGLDLSSEKKITSSLISPSFLNSYLRRYISSGKESKFIFENILKFLTHPLISEKKLLALLSMLKQFLIVNHIYHPDLLKSAIEVVKPYYLWNRPYGDVARDILQILTVEFKSPGMALRSIILEENPHLENGFSEIELKRKSLEQTIFIFYEKNLPTSRVIQQLLTKLATTESISDTQLQINILATILGNSLNQDMTSLGLERLSSEQINKFFETAIEIMNEAVLLHFNEAEAFRTRELSALHQELVNIIDKTAPSFIFTKPLPPCLLPLNLNLIPIECDSTLNQISVSGIPKKSCTEVFLNTINQFARCKFTSVTEKKILTAKFAICGRDSTIHDILCSYVSLKSTSMKILEDLDIHFYMLPTEHCDFSSFLSQYDGWYGRTVVCQLTSVQRILPLLKNSESVDNSPSQDAPFSIDYISPPLILRQNLENYFRYAKWKLDINIYQCDCWNQLSDNPYVSLPFIQRVEIGFRPQLKLFQKNNEQENSGINSQKSFKFIPPSLINKFTSMSVLGTLKQGTPMEPRTYHSVSINNLPFSDDKGTPANPTKPWLELSLIEDKKSFFASKNKVSPGNVNEVDTCTSYHIITAEIESEDKKKSFHILVDNVLHGPFIKIKISPFSIMDEELRFPVYTCYPFDFIS